MNSGNPQSFEALLTTSLLCGGGTGDKPLKALLPEAQRGECRAGPKRLMGTKQNTSLWDDQVCPSATALGGPSHIIGNEG